MGQAALLGAVFLRAARLDAVALFLGAALDLILLRLVTGFLRAVAFFFAGFFFFAVVFFLPGFLRAFELLDVLARALVRFLAVFLAGFFLAFAGGMVPSFRSCNGPSF